MKIEDLTLNVIQRITENAYHMVAKKQFDRVKLPGFLDSEEPTEEHMAYCYIESDYGSPFRLTCSKEGKFLAIK